jgi:hypothetical protein
MFDTVDIDIKSVRYIAKRPRLFQGLSLAPALGDRLKQLGPKDRDFRSRNA